MEIFNQNATLKLTQHQITVIKSYQDADETSRFSASFSRCRNSPSSTTSLSWRDFRLRKCSRKSRSPSRSICRWAELAIRWNDFSTTDWGWLVISCRRIRSSNRFVGRSSSPKSTFCIRTSKLKCWRVSFLVAKSPWLITPSIFYICIRFIVYC